MEAAKLLLLPVSSSLRKKSKPLWTLRRAPYLVSSNRVTLILCTFSMLRHSVLAMTSSQASDSEPSYRLWHESGAKEFQIRSSVQNLDWFTGKCQRSRGDEPWQRTCRTTFDTFSNLEFIQVVVIVMTAVILIWEWRTMYFVFVYRSLSHPTVTVFRIPPIRCQSAAWLWHIFCVTNPDEPPFVATRLIGSGNQEGDHT